MDKNPNNMGLNGLSLGSVLYASRGQVLLTGILQTRQSGEDEVDIQHAENRSRDSWNEALFVRSADV